MIREPDREPKPETVGINPDKSQMELVIYEKENRSAWIASDVVTSKRR